MIDLYHKYKINIFVVNLLLSGLMLCWTTRARYFWSYFEKVAHKLVVWAYVALCVWMCVTGASVTSCYHGSTISGWQQDQRWRRRQEDQ